MKKIYAIQRLDNGQVFDYCETKEQASYWLNMNNPKFELVPTNLSNIVVTYTELGGPHGYGHQECSFETYGGITRCMINLYKWVQREISIWGPDLRDIKDYLKKCRVVVNGEDKSEWFLAQVDKMKGLYV